MRRTGKVAAMAQPSSDLIRGISIFADLDNAAIAQLASDFIEREFSAGDAIATEGEGGLNFFVVESGTADVLVGGNAVGTLGPGD
jgi:CRP-like cAMP-binding protein